MNNTVQFSIFWLVADLQDVRQASFLALLPKTILSELFLYGGCSPPPSCGNSQSILPSPHNRIKGGNPQNCLPRIWPGSHLSNETKHKSPNSHVCCLSAHSLNTRKLEWMGVVKTWRCGQVEMYITAPTYRAWACLEYIYIHRSISTTLGCAGFPIVCRESDVWNLCVWILCKCVSNLCG